MECKKELKQNLEIVNDSLRMKTYILQFIYKEGNGWAFVNAHTPSQAESIFKNQTKYESARVTNIKETKWFGQNMQLVYEGAVTTYASANIKIDLADVIKNADNYESLGKFLVDYINIGNYYDKDTVDTKLQEILKQIDPPDLSNYYNKTEIDNKLKAIPQGPVGPQGPAGETPVITISEDGYWEINGVKQKTKAIGQTFAELSEEEKNSLKGIGITNVKALFGLSNSNTSAPTTWSETATAPNSTKKYIWVKYRFVFSDNSTKESNAVVIGNYAKEGSGGTPTTPFNWEGKKYIACGDSLTDPSQTVLSQANKYCNLAAAELNMQLTNIGISGSTMCYKEGKSVASGNGVPRSFVHELLEGNTTASPENATSASVVGNNYQGPTNINWGEYDLITILLGTNDVPRMSTNAKWIEVGDENSTELYQFYHAYEVSIQTILSSKKSGAVLILCIPPKATAAYYNIDKIKPVIEALGAKYNLPIIDFYSVDVELRSDGVHPTIAGQETMKQVLLNKLAQISGSTPASGGGCNVLVVDDEAEAVESDTLYFFDNSLLRGVGLYNTLLQEGSLVGKDGKTYTYHPGKLYNLYEDGSFDEIDKNTVSINSKDNYIYYNGVRTNMLEYGEILVSKRIKYANTSDTAYLNLRVSGPFFKEETPVTISYDTSLIEISEPKNIHTLKEIPFDHLPKKEYEYYVHDEEYIPSGKTFNFNYTNFSVLRNLIIKRKYSNISELKTPLDVYIKFSTPVEEITVTVKYSKAHVLYKGGDPNPCNPMGGVDITTNPLSGEFIHLGNKVGFNNRIWMTAVSGYWRIASDYTIDQTKFNVFYVKRLDATKIPPTLDAIRNGWQPKKTPTYKSSEGYQSYYGAGNFRPFYTINNGVIFNSCNIYGNTILACSMCDVHPDYKYTDDYSNAPILTLDGLDIRIFNNSGSYCFEEIGILTYEDPFDMSFIDDDYK